MSTQERINPYDIPDGGFRMQPLLPSQLLEIGWYDGCYAVDVHGNEVNATDDWAIKWSITGAMLAVYRRQTFDSEFDDLLFFAAKAELHGRRPQEWEHDQGRTQEEVVMLMRKAEQNIGLNQIIPTPQVRRY